MVGESEPAGVLTLRAPVYTEDGILLGQLTEIHSRHFQVTPPQAPAYWLSTACSRSAGEGGASRSGRPRGSERLSDGLPRGR